MEDIKQISILSDFLSKKVKEKGWSKREFAEKTGLNETYVYKLLSWKREFTPNDETLENISKVLELSEKDSKYLLELAARERETGNIIYEDVPAPHPDPQSSSPPAPSVPAPSVDAVPWTHKKVIIALAAGLLGGLLVGCCGAWTLMQMFMIGVPGWRV